jgi:flagellar export protein FliJ
MGQSGKFHFKLQPLLNKERIYEEECVGRLRDIQGLFMNEKNELENLKKSKLDSQSLLSSRKNQVIASDELRTYEDYFLNIGYRIDSSKSRIQEISTAMNTVQEELVEIIKKRKGLEKLRDRWEEEYKIELELVLNREMDDIAMTKFSNKLVTENDQA